MSLINTQSAAELKNKNSKIGAGKNNQEERAGAYIIMDGNKRKIETLEEFNEITRERVKQITETGKSDSEKAESDGGIFREGSLLRGAVEKRIFIIEKGFRKNIYLEYLHMFCGQRVWTVDDEELNQIPLWPGMVDGGAGY